MVFSLIASFALALAYVDYPREPTFAVEKERPLPGMHESNIAKLLKGSQAASPMLGKPAVPLSPRERSGAFPSIRALAPSQKEAVFLCVVTCLVLSTFILFVILCKLVSIESRLKANPLYSPGLLQYPRL